MAYLVGTCPHCKARDIAMTVFGSREIEFRFQPEAPKDFFALVSVCCGKCNQPTCYTARPTLELITDCANETQAHGLLWQELKRAVGENRDISNFKLVFEPVFPPMEREVPTDLPADVEKAFVQAEVNFAQESMEEPAAVMYGRALERAIKAKHSELNGTLAENIKKLVKTNVIPEAMGHWANDIRVIRNNGAHDDGVSREDLTAQRDFTDAFLRYLFSMPAMVERGWARRDLAKAKQGAE